MTDLLLQRERIFFLEATCVALYRESSAPRDGKAQKGNICGIRGDPIMTIVSRTETPEHTADGRQKEQFR